MHCRTCGYALWNLTQPRCPECGTDYRLRDYRFRPDTVGFACPHCGHLHGGAGEQHLPAETDQAVCLGCGKTMTVNAMRVVPLVDDLRQAEAMTADRLPWDDRAVLGKFKAWWQTTTLFIKSPLRTAERIDPNVKWNDAYWFAAWTYGFGMLAQFLMVSIILIGMGIWMISQNDSGAIAMFLMAAIMPIFAIVGALLSPLAIILFSAAPAHLFLKLTGEKQGHFSLTAASVLYAQAPLVFFAIPLCGYYLNGAWQIWALVLSILITMRTQKVSGLRATFAFLWLSLLMMIAVIALFVLILVASPSFNP